MVYVDASTLKEAISEIAAEHEEFKYRVLDEKGDLRRFINVYVNGKNVRFMEGLNTRLSENDEITIIPAVGGG